MDAQRFLVKRTMCAHLFFWKALKTQTYNVLTVVLVLLVPKTPQHVS